MDGEKNVFPNNHDRKRRQTLDYAWLESNPDFVKKVDRKKLERCLDVAETIMKKEPAFLEIEGEVIFVGDTHGDFEVTKEVTRLFFEDKTRKLVFLGDYIDRAPADISTSIPNISYLLFLKCAHPYNIILLKGNHEANYAIPCFPYEFEAEIESQHPGLHRKFVEAFIQMPLMVLVNNIFASHGGILIGYTLDQLRKVSKYDIHAIEAATWSDPAISETYRGAGFPFNGEDLKDFLEGLGAKMFIRGHDYSTLGTVIFGNSCLTIFSSRRYMHMGNKGVLIARAKEKLSSLDELTVEESTGREWKKYKTRSTGT